MVNEENFWSKSKLWHIFVIFGFSFFVLALFSSYNISLRLFDVDLTLIFVEAFGPILVFIFLYEFSASGTRKERLRDILEAMYIWRDKKHLKDAFSNIVIWGLLSFSLVLPILVLQANLFNSLHYVFKFSFTDAITNYLSVFVLNLFLVTIWEEILFRGYLTNFIHKKMKRFKIFSSILISSLIFMIFHIFSTGPGEGLIKGKHIGGGKGTWIWWKK